jgi:cytochrome c biogenesis protein CcmG/thiol:disulfide interchange protein DsbE
VACDISGKVQALQSNKSILLIFGLVVAAVGAVIVWAAGNNMSPSMDPSILPAPKSAPNFELELLSGEKVKLSDFKGRKPIVLNFWASWCPPCREEAPVLAKVGKEYAGDVEFIGLAVNDNATDVKKVIESLDITYGNGLDKTDIAAAYRVTGTPETFWIDKNGQIIDHWIGPIDETNLKARINLLLEN